MTIRFTRNGSIVELTEVGEYYHGPNDEAALVRLAAEKVARMLEGTNQGAG